MSTKSSLSIFFCVLCLAFACSTEIEETSIVLPEWQKLNDSIYHLTMANVDMAVNSKAAGRITTLAVDGVNLLTGPEIDSINYGSTLWLSPQQLWLWPPPVTLDQHPYKVLQDSDKLYLQSDIDKRFGVSFGKKITPTAEDTSLTIDYTIQNHTDSLQQYAMWEVTRMLKDSRVYFALEEDTTLRSIRDSFWTIKDDLVEVSVSSRDTLNNKMYANGKGWHIYLKDSLALIKTFQDIKAYQLPPTHNEIEVYIARTPYQEVEQHSPFVSLAPGETYHWQVRWYPRKLPRQKDLQLWIEKLQNRIN